jgi:hypothetical protein
LSHEQHGVDVELMVLPVDCGWIFIGCGSFERSCREFELGPQEEVDFLWLLLGLAAGLLLRLRDVILFYRLIVVLRRYEFDSKLF